MEDWQERVIDESDALREKAAALQEFLHSDRMDELEPIDRMLLVAQYNAMLTYAKVLDMRISRF